MRDTFNSQKAQWDNEKHSVERLQKMAPKTVAKLHNTLMKQFKVADAASVVNALVARGILTVAGTRVSWEPAQTDW